MDERLVLIQFLIALLTVAVALGTPRIRAGIAAGAQGRSDEVEALDDFAQRVKALSKQAQSDLVFPHLASLRTIEPVHDLFYVRPDSNPDPRALAQVLRISQRARELNFGPKQLLTWTFTYPERTRLIHELGSAEAAFVSAYWQARLEMTQRRRWSRLLRRRTRAQGAT